MLKKTFLELCNRYTSNLTLAEKFWSEIEKAYNGPKRFYHNLDHLQHLIDSLKTADQINNWDTLLFSVFYHDAVYNVVKKDNEEQSALLASRRLTELGVSEEIKSECRQQILATKNHEVSENVDVNFFIDADLAILGSGWESYDAYIDKIRKQYKVYPDIIYKPGRRKVVQHFLAM
jgi:predicted metal-dependent HD superfamily phosphohydrolase